MPIIKKKTMIPKGKYKAELISVSEPREINTKSGFCHCVRFTLRLENGRIIGKDFFYHDGEVKETDPLGQLIIKVDGVFEEEKELNDFTGMTFWVTVDHSADSLGRIWENVTDLEPEYADEEEPNDGQEPPVPRPSRLNSSNIHCNADEDPEEYGPAPVTKKLFSHTGLPKKRVPGSM
jgi:hypothetical protein